MTFPQKDNFALPDGIIYLDGNSLGPLPNAVPKRLQSMMIDEWGQQLIRGWNACGWMEQPGKLGDRLGRLIGAPIGCVVLGDTLSIKVFQALSAALDLRTDRKVILSDKGNFPTDLYMAEGLIKLKAAGYELRTVAPENVASSVTEDVAVVMLTEVDYRTGRKHDAPAITKAVHDAGAVMIWDLAHSAGAIEVDVTATNCEFAIGCTYKYLNAGPGAPAFIYVRPDLASQIDPALSGWLGHDSPFAFEPRYAPGQGIERMRVGTPPVLQMAALDAALDIWDKVEMSELRAACLKLSDLFITEVEKRCPDLQLVTPRDHAMRGSQVSFAFENGYAAMQAVIDRGVIGDFRAPNIMRFGITPLYLDDGDIIAAAEIIEDVISNRLWDRPEYLAKKKVT